MPLSKSASSEDLRPAVQSEGGESKKSGDMFKRSSSSTVTCDTITTIDLDGVSGMNSPPTGGGRATGEPEALSPQVQLGSATASTSTNNEESGYANHASSSSSDEMETIKMLELLDVLHDDSDPSSSEREVAGHQQKYKDNKSRRYLQNKKKHKNHMPPVASTAGIPTVAIGVAAAAAKNNPIRSSSTSAASAASSCGSSTGPPGIWLDNLAVERRTTLPGAMRVEGRRDLCQAQDETAPEQLDALPPSLQEESLIEATLVPDDCSRHRDDPEDDPEAAAIVEAKPMSGLHLHVTKRTVSCACILVLLFMVVGAAIAGGGMAKNDNNTPEAAPPKEPEAHTSSSLAMPDTPSSSSASPSSNEGRIQINTLARIREEGVLRCGVNPSPEGQVTHWEAGPENTFDFDLCRAIAAAIMGRNAYKVEVLPYEAHERPKALVDGEVDVMFNFVSQTMEAEVYDESVQQAISFASPYLVYDTHFSGRPDMVTCADNGLRYIQECSDIKVCIHGTNIYFDLIGLQLPRDHILQTTDIQASVKSFMMQECNVIHCAAFFQIQQIMSAFNYNGEFHSSDHPYTINSLNPVTRSDDPMWTWFVDWVVQSTFEAERVGITMDNVDDDPQGQQQPRFVHTNVFGDEYQNMFYDAIATSGNFQEMYERRINPQFLKRPAMSYGVNSADSGMMRSRTFGKMELLGPAPHTDGTMAMVASKGALQCGITASQPGFAVKVIQQENGTATVAYQGMDVDYCRAIAAAILGNPDLVEFINLNSTQEGFTLLHEERIDVLAGASWNLVNAAREPTTGVGFSFSRPYFYNSSVFLQPGRNSESTRCLAVRQNDHEFKTLVYWVVEAMVRAEENGITQGTANEMPAVMLYGSKFSRIFRDVIASVGSYGEVYERNLAQHIPRAGMNLLYNTSHQSPLIPMMPGMLEIPEQ